MLKLLLRNRQSPGDILMLTAAVRDLHLACPGAYQVAVETSCPELWENNPHVVARDALGEPDLVVDCEYPLVHRSNQQSGHFLLGFLEDLERKLGLGARIWPSAFRGDLHLSREEIEAPSPVRSLGYAGPYWVIIAGGKYDCTAKWWDPGCAQEVIDHYAGRIQFVQCGQAGHWHPPLRGVLNLVGRTSLREFLRVLYHADGVVCPVTFTMHAAAALPSRPGGPRSRPCVVIAGGREPPHWEMYPGHQFLHTVGALDCCATGGCWKSRCQPVGDGHAQDDNLCPHPVTAANGLQLARCMTMITPRKVIDAVDLYYEGGILQFPSGHPAAENRPRNIEVRPNGVAVTIGVGPCRDMARLAARELGARTGLATVVIGDDDYAASGLERPEFLKFRLFDLVKADNLLFFDADMVCLADWRPQAFFGSEAIVGVRDIATPVIREDAARWGVPLEQYFNTGLFIANRQAHGDWLRHAEAIRFQHPTVFRDQAPLNAARCQLGLPQHLLDRRYNWVWFGDSSLSHDMPVVMAHKLAPWRPELNAAYFGGEYELLAPSIRINEPQMQRLAGRSFVLLEDGTRSTLTLRSDGTILPIGEFGREEYWFVHDAGGRPTLALASQTAILRQFIQAMRGTWIPATNGSLAQDGARLIDATVGEAGGISEENARDIAEECLRRAPPYPAGRFQGRGIVICGGGERYFPGAWVCIRMLRRLGCPLPIELWHASPDEMPATWRAMVEPLGVRCRDAAAERLRHPVRILDGWAMKPFAMLHSAFEEVLLLDADNVPVRDPSPLFDAPAYAQAGAVFWPDYGRLAPDRAIWRICRVGYRDEPEFESGQVLVDKRRCWRALHLTMHMNEHGDFYYSYVHGDKETYHMAWRMLDQPYAMVEHPIHPLPATMCQHDFEGRRLFQHRNLAKWTVAENRRIPGFLLEDECLAFLQELHRTAPPAGDTARRQSLR